MWLLYVYLIIINVFCTAPDEEPVYVYDYRGLRVRADSTSKVQDSTTATLTTPQSHATKPRPKSASAALNNSSAGKWKIWSNCKANLKWQVIMGTYY